MEGVFSARFIRQGDDSMGMAQTSFEYAREVGVKLFNSPFDESVKFLEQEINPGLYKIASFELNHFPLLKEIGKTTNMIIGISTEFDIQQTIECLKTRCPEITLLHCVSEYPANLRFLS